MAAVRALQPLKAWPYRRLAAAVLAWAGGAAAQPPCPAPGDPIHWIADYCMLKLETDDEIVASGCIARESRRHFATACAANTWFKRRMCQALIRSATREDGVERCVRDPAFQGRTVRNRGVGG